MCYPSVPHYSMLKLLHMGGLDEKAMPFYESRCDILQKNKPTSCKILLLRQFEFELQISVNVEPKKYNMLLHPRGISLLNRYPPKRNIFSASRDITPQGSRLIYFVYLPEILRFKNEKHFL